jgi:serine/threonine-protein kinase
MKLPAALDKDVVEDTPVEFLRRAGEVFAEFGPDTQDSGNFSYGVRVGGDRFFVKTAGSPDDSGMFLSHLDRVALLGNAIRVAKTCGHRSLPRLHRVIESPHGPMLLYDWLDGELVGVPATRRYHPASAYQRFRGLATADIVLCLDLIYELHRDLARLGWIAVDFYDGCVLYDFDAHRVGIVDLDNYHPGPFVNEMGRMFGSSRFMAPEEFELGALIDERTNVFVMGRTAAVFLGDASLDRAKFRGSARMHSVIERACAQGPTERFQSMQEFYDAWAAARAA